MIHSILNIENNALKSIPILKSVFSDLNTKDIFSEEAVEVLCRPCDRETIHVRQEVFSLLCDTEYLAWFESLHRKITAFSQMEKAFLSPSISEASRSILFYAYLQSYLDFVVSSSNEYESFFMNRMNENSVIMQKSMDDIKEEISQYQRYVCEASAFSVTFDSGNLSLKNCDVMTDGVSRKIYHLCEEIGYTGNTGSNCDIKIEQFLSDGLIKLYPEAFAKMEQLQDVISAKIDADVKNVKLEMEFYIFINNLRVQANDSGIPYCIPEISSVPEYKATSLFDISLMKNGISDIVPNDIEVSLDDSLYFIRGANGGGKTTYLRAVAINLILFISGCPVFCKSASIYPFQKVFTHFPENEGFADGGRLLNEEIRLRDVSLNSDAETFIFLNETFSGADEAKGSELSVNLMRDLRQNRAFCLFVTHFHNTEKSGFPALVTVVDYTDENRRSYRIVKNEKISSSFANDILRKHRLDAMSLRERVKND